MADENVNTEVSTPDPTTGISNGKSIVHDGVATFIINGVSTDVKLKAGQIGCFVGSEYTLEDTGILKDKSPRPGVMVWGCKIGGVEYTFDNNGHCEIDAENVETHHLYIAASSINVAEGTLVQGMTRSGQLGSKTVSIDSITVRDQFAMTALEALIYKMEDPVECSTATCKYVTDKAYEFANAMMVSSAEARAQYEEPSGGGTPGIVDVPENDLANNTEKLLNNIYKTLDAQKTQDANQHAAGIKISTINDVMRVDNPENAQHVVDKFQVEGGGGGGSISYDDIPMLTETGQTTMSHVLGFATDTENHKYVGKLTFVTFAAKIWTAITSSVQSLIDSRGTINIASGGAWYTDLVNLIDSRITTKVKSEALNP